MHSKSERGGIIGALFLTMGILVLVAIVATFCTGLYIARHVSVSATDNGGKGGSVSVETPFGSVHVRDDAKLDPRRLGVPVYPGAVLNGDHHNLAQVEVSFGHDDAAKQFAVVAGEYTTTDDFEKVRDYYRGELPHWMVSNDRHGRVNYSFTEGGYKKIVVLEAWRGGTRIKLASVGEPPVN